MMDKTRAFLDVRKFKPIKRSLQLEENKMNSIIGPFCFIFAGINFFYAFLNFVLAAYGPEDGIYFFQPFFMAFNGILQLGCGLYTRANRVKNPSKPKYLFLTICIIKAVINSIFIDGNLFVLYMIPIIFCVGFYDVHYSLWSCIAATLSYILGEYIGMFFGIQDINFYGIESIVGNTYVLIPEDYPFYASLGVVIPNTMFLLVLGALAILLTKKGANSLLREYVVNKDKAALDKELSLGTEIQNSMLPDRILESDYFSAFSYMVSAKNVGGDFFDYFELEGGKVLITIGDVSGKGISASLFASNTKALIRAFAMSGYDPGKILQETNASLCGTNKRKLFVTVWLGIFDLATGDLAYCNAGHNPPVIKRANGELEWVKNNPNFVIGRRKYMAYDLHHLTLQPGDAIALYTDGVTEAMNEKQEMFGEERLLSYIRDHEAGERFTKDLRKEIFKFRGEAEQNDDISMVCFKYNIVRTLDSETRDFKATREEFPHLSSFVMDFVSKYSQDRKVWNDIEICLGEVFSNIQNYSSADGRTLTDVTVKLRFEEETLTIEFADNGIPFNPLDRPKPSLEENRKNHVIGGFGIFMVKNLMDEVTYRYENKNILTLKKSIKETGNEN